MEAGSLKLGCQYGQVLVKILFWLPVADLLCPHMAEHISKLPGGCYKDTDPIYESSTL